MLAVLAGMTGCSRCRPSCPENGPHDVADRAAYGVIDSRSGALQLTASCQRGEQLIGGGYWIDTTGSAPGEAPPVIAVPPGAPHSVVLGSYPSADASSWVVEFWYRPIAKSSVGPTSQLVAAHAYCVTNPELRLGMQVRSAPESESSPNRSVASAVAPMSATVTGGGFRMQYAPNEVLDPLPNINANVEMSAPLVDGERVVGWTAARQTVFPGKVTAYVLFATSGLESGAVLRAEAEHTSLGAGPYWKQLQCPDGEFAAAGGFEFANTGPLSVAIPHWMSRNLAVEGSTQWLGYGFDAYNTAQYSPGSTVASVAISAVCLKSPYPRLCVRITRPDDETTVDIGPDDPALTTVPVRFSADAFRGGVAMPGSSIRWFVDGVALGTGNDFEAPLPLGAPVPHDATYVADQVIRAEVVEGSRTASDAIRMHVIHTGTVN